MASLQCPRCAYPSSPTALSQPAQRISIRKKSLRKIHKLQPPRLADLLHPRYQNDLFFQGKQLWTLKVDKHCNLFLFYCSIRYPKSSYQSRTEMQNNFHCWKHRLTTCSSSNYCTSLVAKNGSVSILLSSDLPGSSSDPQEQQAHQPCWYTMLLLLHRGRLKPDPGAAGEEHTWQRPSVLTAPIRFCSQNLQIYLHLLLSSSLSVLTLAPASSCETIALPLVTATGIRSTAKIRIF